jgi:hypothetical protein
MNEDSLTGISGGAKLVTLSFFVGFTDSALERLWTSGYERPP